MSFDKSESKMDYSSMMDHSADLDSDREDSQVLSKITLDLVCEMPGCTDKELVRNLEVLQLADGSVALRPLLFKLKEIGFNLEGALVSYRSVQESAYVYCGSDPLPESAHVPLDELTPSDGGHPRLELKFKPGLRASTILEEAGEPSEGKNPRRTKERKIGFIIQRVSLWRKLYNGVPDGNNNIVRYSLEEAAHKVGISKKSLDDYLLQLRFGRKFGFNFNDHRDSKVGVLRAFVKKNKLQHNRRKA